MPRLKQRECNAIIQALRAGVVPKLGLRHIQVGRSREVQEMLKDIERIKAGGATIRFIIGKYGSGKTFFLNLTRLIAMEKGMVVLSADLAPDRRLHATGGQARSLYAEMAHNASTRTKPGGGAMTSIVERFASTSLREAKKAGRNPDDVMRDNLEELEELTGGYDFTDVIVRYWEGYENGDENLKIAAIRWLRAEFSTLMEARKALGVRTIINDVNVYDHLKLLAWFVRKAGYKGLLVSLDELVNLYRLNSSQARNNNYEQILRILNDVLQGSARYLGFMLGGTPEFLMDTRRGLYSNEALQSRLPENMFAQGGLVDLSGPVVRLANLTPEDMLVLLRNIRGVVFGNDSALPDEALKAFMTHCSNKIGEAYFQTPRHTVTAFVNMLSVLQQNPDTDWHELIDCTELSQDSGDGKNGIEDDGTDDELASFKL